MKLAAFLSLIAGVCMTLVSSLPAVALDDPPPVNADPDEAVVAGYAKGQGQFGNVDLPDCGPININGRASNNSARAAWYAETDRPSGTTTYVGDVWEIRFGIESEGVGGPYGNDGPSPLILDLTSLGAPLSKVAKTGQYDGIHNHGGDSVGSLGPVNKHGWAFDSDSSPKAGQISDGALAEVIVTVRANTPGNAVIKSLQLSGYDSTGLGAEFSCSIPLDWSWDVEPILPPEGGYDVAATDAIYATLVTGDASLGDHAIDIDVLADDRDPNTASGPGVDVAIESWQSTTDQGGSFDCGDDDLNGADVSFDEFETGPCRYVPPVGFSGQDVTEYRLRQRTGGASTTILVTINVHPNEAPVAAEALFGAQQNTPTTFDLEPGIIDPQGDPFVCNDTGLPEPSGGTIEVSSDCMAEWTPNNGFFGTATASYRACDLHPTLAVGQLGTNAHRAPSYSVGDVDSGTASRCTLKTVSVNVSPGLILPPTGVAETDVVDAGYAGDGVGPYTIEVPVLDNDFDGNGPKPGSDGWGGVVEAFDFPADTGTVAMAGENIRFTPADGFSGSVPIKYRVCEDPAQQNPPYNDLPICGVGLLVVVVVPNQAPVPAVDAVVGSPGETLTVDDVLANDVEPEGEPMICVPGSVDVDPAAIATNAELSAACKLSVTLAPDAGQNGTASYRVCDQHLLEDPAHPAVPYGADGRSPGEIAPRCATGTIDVSVLVDDDDNSDPPPDLDCQDDCNDLDEGAATTSTSTPSAPTTDAATTTTVGATSTTLSSPVPSITSPPQLPATGSANRSVMAAATISVLMGLGAVMVGRRRKAITP